MENTFPYNFFEETMDMLFKKKRDYQKKSRESVKQLFTKKIPESQEPSESHEPLAETSDFQLPSIFNLFRKKNVETTEHLEDKQEENQDKKQEEQSQISIDENILKGTKMYYQIRRQQEYALQ